MAVAQLVRQNIQLVINSIMLLAQAVVVFHSALAVAISTKQHLKVKPS
ncbi:MULTISPECIES: hypothetical protein [Acinetobacter]|nr:MULTISPECIES: hypothetical protein [Acinetobacter]MDX8272802.1 hypothetical protein [Acinetobacter pittii]